MRGIVLKSVGSWYDIKGENGDGYKGRLKGKFKMEDKRLTNPIAVGDRVHFTIEHQAEGTVIIDEIEPRENYIIRKAAHKTEHSHLIASNIDLALLVVTLVYPETSLGFIDRFLVAAESFRIPVKIVFNKSDLYTDELIEYQQQLVSIYGDAGYESSLVSAENYLGINELKDSIMGKVVLFSGHSGVGKSTLMNKISPGLSQKTLPISNFANKGVHTTTFAEMFDIGNNTFVIDTPGIKEFGISEIEKPELGYCFPEIRQRLGECRFHNCMHVNEPGCAVREAVAEGKLPASRYKTYISIYMGEDNRK